MIRSVASLRVLGFQATLGTRRSAGRVESPQQQQHRRALAYGTNWKTKPKASTPMPKGRSIDKPKQSLVLPARPPTRLEEDRTSGRPRQFPDRASLQTRESRVVPPALLLPTASPHAFVAKHAVDASSSSPSSAVATTTTRDSPYARPTTLFHAEASGALDVSQLRPRCRYHGTTAPAPSTSEDASFLPEVAFLGRSNVGKSSLLNALAGQPLQRVGKQPGRTQHPHYVECSDKRSSTSSNNNLNVMGYLMDLPGYGYGVGPEGAVDAWQRRTQQALLRRRDVGALRRVYLLVDARHGATTLDASIMGWLEEGEIPFTVALTKADATTAPYVVKHANQICMRYHHEASASRDAADAVMISPVVHVTSAKKRTGLAELWSSVLRDFRAE